MKRINPSQAKIRRSPLLLREVMPLVLNRNASNNEHIKFDLLLIRSSLYISSITQMYLFITNYYNKYQVNH
jgi:hypothetical protein